MGTAARKVIIVGGGIAGLCAAVYAQKSGYQAEVLEMHDSPGGLATSWHRNGYTFDNCLHWLLGSNPSSDMFARWREVFDIDQLHFIDHAEFARIQTAHGEELPIYSNVDRMEQELLIRAPEDARAIQHFAASIRSLSAFKLPDLTTGFPGDWLTLLRDLPYLPLVRHLAHVTAEEYGAQFENPLLRAFFGTGDSAQMSVLALIFSLAWMHNRNAGYPVGGSQAVIQPIARRLDTLGGTLRLKARVEKILVENDTAIGVRLSGGEILHADWVISAADGHATIFALLEPRYLDRTTEKIYRDLLPFPSYLQVSLGIAQDLSRQPPFAIRLLDAPLQVDPETRLHQVPFRFFHFDPTFAPAGRTAVTCVLPTRNHEFWMQQYTDWPEAYRMCKQRVASAVIEILQSAVGTPLNIEEVDVATPATVIRYTGNWKGSMEGWLPTPHTGFGQLPNTIAGLRHFVMAGHWTMPGGGLPSGLLTARAAIRKMCEHDHLRFAHAA